MANHTSEHFGHRWMHNATVIEVNIPMDEEALLRRNQIAKFHSVIFFAGRTLKVPTSPLGNQYLRIPRSADWIADAPTLPQ